MSSRTFARRLLGLPWPPLLAVSLVLSFAIALVVQRTIGTRQLDAAGELSIFVSGDAQGMLIPCAAGQAGGLAQRSEIVRSARAAAAVLYADAGNAAGGISPYDRLKFATMLRGEMSMGVAAHNLGPGEVRLGADELHRLASELKVPFVSTNVRDAQGRPLAEPVRLIEVAGRRMVIVGLLSPSYTDESLDIADPAAALSQALAEQAPHYDVVLVLAYLPAEELSELALRLPKKAVLVGPSHGESMQSGDRSLAGVVGRDGRSLVRIDFAANSRDQWTAQDVLVSAALPEDAKQLDHLVAYHQELAKHDFSPEMTGLSVPLPTDVASTQRVAGTHTCRACHAQESAIWDTSRHARAWQSLVDRGVQYDAACQRCHATGYGWEGGFDSADYSIGTVSVGCESCHGPSLTHVLNPGIRTPLIASQQCAQCHTGDTAPGFDYAAAWAFIRHGARPLGAATPAVPPRRAAEHAAGDVN